MLDFYLLGLARSGTTVFSNILNLHPNIYCGHQRFPIKTDPELLDFSVSDRDSLFSSRAVALGNKKKPIDLCTNGPNKFRLIGDKNTQKFYYPYHLNKVKYNFLLYRSYKDVSDSWDKVAGSHTDSNWPAQKVGIYFFIELLIFFQVISNLKNVIVVNYEHLFFGDYKKELAQIFHSIGLSDQDFPYDEFRNKFFSKKRKFIKTDDKNKYDDIAENLSLIKFENDFFNAKTKECLNIVRNYGHFINSNRDELFEVVIRSNEVIKAPEQLYVINKNIIEGFSHSDVLNFLPQVSKSNPNKITKAFFHFPVQGNPKKTLIAEKYRLLEIVNIMPQIGQSHYDLGLVYLKLKNSDKAIEYIQQAISLDDSNYQWHLRLAKLLIKKNSFYEAEVCLKKAIDIMPKQADSYFELGFLCVKQNRIDSAKYYFNKGSHLDEGNYQYLNQMARFLIENDELEEAKIVLKKSLTVGKEIALTYALLSRLYSKQKKLDKAIENIKEAIIFENDNLDYKYRLAHLLFQNNDYMASERVLNHFIKTSSTSDKLAEAHALLSHIHTKKKNFDDALEQIEKAIRLDNQKSRFRHHWENLHKRLNKKT